MEKLNRDGTEMAGIERIKIISNWEDRYTEISRKTEPTANLLYRHMLRGVGIDLSEGDEWTEVEKDSLKSRYDHQEGIDIILTATDGTRLTLQEKILTHYEDTLTFETRKRSGKLGAWYYCTSQLYFVGYLSRCGARFRSGMMVNLAELKRVSLQGGIQWEYNREKKLNRGTEFKFIRFSCVPRSAIVFQYHRA